MKFIKIIFALVVVTLFTGCSGEITPEEFCSENGVWLEEHNECEYITQEECEILGGTFDECSDACRHDQDAEMCITLCVPVCYFN